MSQSNESTNPQELADAHRTAAYALKRAVRVQKGIQQSGLVKRAVSKLKGETSAAQKSVEEAQSGYDATANIPQGQVEAIHGQVNEVLATQATYNAERERVTEEVTSQYKERVESMTWPGSAVDEKSYVEDFANLKARHESTPETSIAKALAVRDVFYPKVDNPGYAGMTFMIGEDSIGQTELAIHNGQRFPRFEVGSDEASEAVSVATANGWNSVVNMSVSVTAASAPEGEKPYVLGEKNVYTAVSDETAALLDLAMPEMGSSSNLYEAFGRRQGMGTSTASHVKFSTLNVSELNTPAPQAV